MSTNFLGWEGSTGSIEGGIEGEIVAEGGGGKRKNRTYHWRCLLLLLLAALDGRPHTSDSSANEDRHTRVLIARKRPHSQAILPPTPPPGYFASIPGHSCHSQATHRHINADICLAAVCWPPVQVPRTEEGLEKREKASYDKVTIFEDDTLLAITLASFHSLWTWEWGFYNTQVLKVGHSPKQSLEVINLL